MLHAISTVVIVLIALGIYYRKRTSVHYPIMLTAFALDIGMVLYIEIKRHAVKQVIDMTPGPLLWFHIVVSTVVLLLYFVQFYFGWRLKSGKSTSKALHRNTGITFCVLRMINYVTSYII